MQENKIDLSELWKIVLGELELTISKASFTTWFTNTSLQSVNDDHLIINVPNIFAKEWLEKKYKKVILNSIQKHHPQITSFSCQVKQINSLNKDNKKEKTVKNSNYQQVINKEKISKGNTNQTDYFQNKRHFSSNLSPKYSFDNFIVSSNNELAHAACQSISQQPGKNYNPLFIYGGVGLGKTHLLQATGNKILENFPDYKVYYSSTERFSNELVDSIQNNRVKEFKNKYIALDVLILDDIQFLSGKEKSQEEFFHIFESLYQFGKQVILSSDRPPKSIATLEDRLRSRFEGGMIVDVEKPDFETRLAIIDKKLEEKKFQLDKEIKEYLARNIYHNIRELEGALNKIIVTFQFQNRIPNLDDVINLTKDIISVNHHQDITPEKILATVADYFGIKTEDIIGRCRKKQVVKPRQIVFYLLRSEIDMSFPEIGKFLGNRDHSTAIYTYEKIKKELENNNELATQIKFIREKMLDY